MRVRGPGSHANLIDAGTELLDQEDQAKLRSLDRIRRTRNEAEYSGHSFDHEEVAYDLAIMSEAVTLVGTSLGGGP